MPKLLAFLLVLFIGRRIAKALGKVVDKVLERAGFDRVAERGGINRMMSGSEYGRVGHHRETRPPRRAADRGADGLRPVRHEPGEHRADRHRGVPPEGGRGDRHRRVAGASPARSRTWSRVPSAACRTARCSARPRRCSSWGLGTIAALNQIGVATSVTTPVLITVLATVGGIAVIGGGLVRPIQQRWSTG